MFASLDGAEICYDVHGEGEPVLLIAGLGASKDYWSKAPGLLRGYKVITYDNRGVGDTRYEGDFGYDDLIGDAVGLLEHLGIGKAHVVGWSMGSLIARGMVDKRPDLFADMTIMGSYINRPARSWYMLTNMCDMVVSGKAEPECFYRMLNSFTFSEESLLKFEREGREVPVPSELPNMRGVRDQMNAIDLRTIVSGTSTTVPTLVIHGSDDIMVPASESLLIAEVLPNRRLLILKDEGHGIPMKVFSEQLMSFMAEHPAL